MSNNRQRLAKRRLLPQPAEAVLHLGTRNQIQGWVIDEQDAGLGLTFVKDEALRLAECWAAANGAQEPSWIALGKARECVIPVRVVHVTPDSSDGRTCRAGVEFDMLRMRGEDLANLLDVWPRLRAAQPRPATPP